MDRTETSICNMAADFLDSSNIGNINDNFGDAKIYARNYEEAISTVLTEYQWNGVKSRAVLNAIDLPFSLHITDYQAAYSFPSDCLAPIDINGRPVEEIHWDVETIANVDAHGDVQSRRKILLCDAEGSIILRYQSLISPRDMSPHCAKACALELAMRCQGRLKNSTTSMEQLRDLYTEATKGTPKRIGGHQVDSRQNRPLPKARTVTKGENIRAGVGL